jgi:outer membrane protein assembly factor BamB
VNDEAWLGYSSTPAFSNGIGVLYGTWAYAKPLDNGDPIHWMTCPNARRIGLCATNLATGQVLWEKVFDYPEDFADLEYSAPIVVGDTVYVHGPDVMRALDLRSGSLLWESDAPSPGPPNYSWLRPTYVNGVVFVEGFDPIKNEVIMLGFDAATGDLVTRRPRSSKLGPLGGHHTAIANGRLVTTIPGIRVSTFDRP